MNENRQKRVDKLSFQLNAYPAAVAGAGAGFAASFQDTLTLLSPMNEGDFECSG